MQYRSLYEHDGGGEVDPDDGLRCAGAQRIVAHLAFDPARHPPPPAAHYALLQDFVQYRLMQGESGRRGGSAANSGSLRRTTRTACRKESRSGSSSTRSAASCNQPAHGEMRQQQAPELLPDQFWALTA